jgi:hypothetical protein
MDTTGGAARELAARLRALRKAHWPDISITQTQLAEVLAQRKVASVQLISSWERVLNPALPPEDRLSAIATFFSTRRSVEGGRFRLVQEASLTETEARERLKLYRELSHLRQAALAEAGNPAATLARSTHSIVGSGPWQFDEPVMIVCAELPEKLHAHVGTFGSVDPDGSELSNYADLDSLVELYGHIRAVNPDIDVGFRRASHLRDVDLTQHLVFLGGIDWNPATRDAMRLIDIPIVQRSMDDDPSRGYFEAGAGGEARTFAPVFESRDSGRVLVEDVGFFLRAPNPLHKRRSVTVCNGMFGHGVLGTVIALTSKICRDDNTDYLADTFAGLDTFGLLFRVRFMNGRVVPPDWTVPGTVLYRWPES